MSLQHRLKDYESLKCADSHKKYQLDCVKDYFRETKLTTDDSFECDGNGSCYTNIPGTYICYKFSNNCDCQLHKCPNFIVCETYAPQQTLNDYYGLCYRCSIFYKPCGEGRGKLNVFDNMKCAYCEETKKCIEQAFCDDILCLQCFNLAHMKPGNGDCPVCNIKHPIVWEQR